MAEAFNETSIFDGGRKHTKGERRKPCRSTISAGELVKGKVDEKLVVLRLGRRRRCVGGYRACDEGTSV